MSAAQVQANSVVFQSATCLVSFAALAIESFLKKFQKLRILFLMIEAQLSENQRHLFVKCTHPTPIGLIIKCNNCSCVPHFTTLKLNEERKFSLRRTDKADQCSLVIEVREYVPGSVNFTRDHASWAEVQPGKLRRESLPINLNMADYRSQLSSGQKENEITFNKRNGPQADVRVDFSQPLSQFIPDDQNDGQAILPHDHSQVSIPQYHQYSQNQSPFEVHHVLTNPVLSQFQQDESQNHKNQRQSYNQHFPIQQNLFRGQSFQPPIQRQKPQTQAQQLQNSGLLFNSQTQHLSQFIENSEENLSQFMEPPPNIRSTIPEEQPTALNSNRRVLDSQNTFNQMDEDAQSKRSMRIKPIENQTVQAYHGVSRMSSNHDITPPGHVFDPMQHRQSQTSAISRIQETFQLGQANQSAYEQSDKLKNKEQQLQKQIEQLKQQKEQLDREVQNLEFKKKFPGNQNAGQSKEILIWHLLLVSVIGLITGATMKRILSIF